MSAAKALGFVIVKVSDDVAPTEIDGGAKLLAIAGGDGAFTVRCAVAVLPGPSLEKTWTELFFWPGVVAVTLTTMVHVSFGVKERFARLMLAPPAFAVTLEATQEGSAPVTVRPLGVATTSPPGRVSAKFMPVFPPLVEPVTTNVSVVLPPTEIDDAPYDLASVGKLPRNCADPGPGNKDAISTPATAAHTAARQRTSVC